MQSTAYLATPSLLLPLKCKTTSLWILIVLPPQAMILNLISWVGLSGIRTENVQSQDSNLEDIWAWEECKHANRTFICTSLILSLDTRTCTSFTHQRKHPAETVPPRLLEIHCSGLYFFVLLNMIFHDTYVQWLCTASVHSKALSPFFCNALWWN